MVKLCNWAELLLNINYHPPYKLLCDSHTEFEFIPHFGRSRLLFNGNELLWDPDKADTYRYYRCIDVLDKWRPNIIHN